MLYLFFITPLLFTWGTFAQESNDAHNISFSFYGNASGNQKD